jgi:Tol biopolymer transport system component
MAASAYLVAGAAACAVALAAVPNGEGVITIAQRDANRAAKAPRTVDVSANGRFVAFQSWAQLVAADDDERPDVYVLDRQTGRVTLESGATEALTENSHPRISGDGRFVVFESRLTAVDQASRIDIVLRDRDTGATRALTGGAQRGNVFAWSRAPDISDDGRRVAFSSAATSLVPGADMNGAFEDVYVLDVESGALTRVSLTTDGAQLATGSSSLPNLNADGTIVAFVSNAALDLGTAAPVSAARQIYVRDLNRKTTTRISRTPRGARLDGDSSAPSISGDGRYVAFVSDAANIVADDNNRGSDIFVVDRESGRATQVSRGIDGSSPNGNSSNPVVSADGRAVAFQSDAANLVCASHCAGVLEDLNLLWDVFVWDRTTGRIVRASEDELGAWMEWSAAPAIDGSGQVVAFSSRHPIDGSDRAEDLDLFVRPLPLPLTAAKK